LGFPTIKSVDAIVLLNRNHALTGIGQEEIAVTKMVLESVIENCGRQCLVF